VKGCFASCEEVVRYHVRGLFGMIPTSWFLVIRGYSGKVQSPCTEHVRHASMCGFHVEFFCVASSVQDKIFCCAMSTNICMHNKVPCTNARMHVLSAMFNVPAVLEAELVAAVLLHRRDDGSDAVQLRDLDLHVQISVSCSTRCIHAYGHTYMTQITWFSSWHAKLPRASAHFCWQPALSANLYRCMYVCMYVCMSTQKRPAGQHTTHRHTHSHITMLHSSSNTCQIHAVRSNTKFPCTNQRSDSNRRITYTNAQHKNFHFDTIKGHQALDHTQNRPIHSGHGDLDAPALTHALLHSRIAPGKVSQSKSALLRYVDS
jgi:hypothetical protein